METNDLRTSCDKAAVNRVWLYCRTAGNGIASPALDVQEQRLKDYAAEQHWTVAGISSEHFSGNTIVRPGLTEVSKAVLNGKVDTLLVVNLNRIGRVMNDVNFYWAFLQKHHVSLHSILEGEIDLSSRIAFHEALRKASSV